MQVLIPLFSASGIIGIDHSCRIRDIREVIIIIRIVIGIDRSSRRIYTRTLKYIIERKPGTVGGIITSAKIDTGCQVFGNLQTDIGTECIFIISQCVILQQAVIGGITETTVITYFVGTTFQGQSRLELCGVLIENGIIQVYTLITGSTLLPFGQFVLCDISRSACIDFRLISHGHILSGVGHLRHIGRRSNADIGVQRNTRFACSPFLGGNNHGTIRRIHTIDRGSSIFQKRYAFNIFRIQPLKFAGTVSHHSVNHKQRSSEATDIDIGTKLTRLSIFLSDPQTGNFSLNGLCQTRCLCLYYIIYFQVSDSSCQTFLFLNAISDNNYIAQCYHILLKDYRYEVFIHHFHSLRIIADISYLQFRSHRNLDSKLTIYIRNSPRTRFQYFH